MAVIDEDELRRLIPLDADITEERIAVVNTPHTESGIPARRFHLRSIRIENFKSYSGVIEVSEFPRDGDESLICVVGPNGSGKSNLMDAVAFCFNCADSTKLRGDGALSNLISGGIPSSQASSALVSITLNDATNESVIFTRTVNSKNESRYKLNNRNVTLEKYREKMVECGLDVRGNFLVFQGDVESLALSTPSDLGSAIDRVSGSSQYKKEYDSLKEKKINQERDLTVLMSRRRNLTNDRKRLSTELAEIEKLKSLKSDISSMRTKRVLTELYALQDSLVQAISNEPEPMEIDSTALASELDDLKSKRAKTDLLKSKTERLIVRAKESLSEAQAGYSEKQSRSTVLNSRQVKIEKELETENSNQNQLKNQIGKVSSQIEVEESHLQTASKDLDDWISRKVSENPDFDSDTQSVIPHLSQLAGKPIEYSQFKSKADSFRKYELPIAMECEKSSLRQVDTELVHVESLITSLRAKESDMSDQLERNVIAEKRASAKFADFETSANEASNESRKFTKEYESTKSRLGRFGLKLNELLERKQTLIDSISAAKETEEQIAKEKCMMEIVSELATKFGDRKVFGRIVDLVSPIDSQWATAIEIAAGKYLDAILVADTNVAKECHKVVKEMSIGRRIPSLTFIPVTDVVVPAPVVVGDCKRVFDIIGIKNSTENLGEDTEYVAICIKRGLEFVFNDCVVCESMKEGRKIAFDRGVKVITKNGEKISGKNGTITIGGQMSSSGKRFNVKQVTEINGKLDVIETQISAARADICVLENEGEKLSRKMREIEIRVNDEIRNREIWKTEVGRIGVQIDVVGKALESVREEGRVVVDKLEELKKKRENVIGTIMLAIESKVKEWTKLTFGITVDDVEILRLIGGCENDVLKSGQNQYEEIRILKRKKRDEIESKIESLKNERRFLKETLDELIERIRGIESEQSDVSAMKKKIEKEIVKAEKLVSEAETKVSELTIEVEGLIRDRSAMDDEIKRLISQIAEKSHVVRPLENSRSKKDQSMNRAIQVLKQSVFDNVFVPLELDDSELIGNATVEEMSRNIIEALYLSLTSMVPASSQREDQDSVENLTKEVLLKINYSLLDSSVKRGIDRAVRQGEVDAKLSQCLSEIDSEVRDKMREIEKLNVHSVFVGGQDPTEIDAELESIGTQIESMKSELASTVNDLKRIRSVRNELFMKCFNFVASKVGELYQILTSYDHGGEEAETTAIVPASTAVASLDLETGGIISSESEVFESGIIFSLMPPFKRYTNIELLSGGEKTVAAVALLFSMLAYSSPPFAMVDEIDAALDAGNVAVLYRFMRHAVKHPVIVISLKEKMYSKADYLIGVYKDVTRGGSSGLITIDLRPYTQEGVEQVAVMGG